MLRGKGKGITLVELVITIVILLILAGISISTLTNTGIFQKAKDAKKASENAEKEQNKILDEYETALDQYDENILVYKVNNGIVKIGDYVSYIPDKANTDKLLEELNKYSGTIENTSETLTQELELKWRVLDAKDGKVRLISDEPTKSTITLFGAKGYNNAVYLLDKICKTLYSNSKLVSNVQNLKIEDIQEKMVEKNYTNIDSNYGNRFSPSNKYYPSILSKEKEQKVTVEENTSSGTELDFSEQKILENQIENKQTDILDVKYTYWYKIMSVNDFDGNNKEMYYNLFINNGSNYVPYWMSSRCIIATTDLARFCVRRVDSGSIYARSVYYSSNSEGTGVFAYRPVITLNSNVQVISGNGSVEEPFNIE